MYVMHTVVLYVHNVYGVAVGNLQPGTWLKARAVSVELPWITAE